MKRFLMAVVAIGLISPVYAQTPLTRYELKVENNASSGIKHIYAYDVEDGQSLGDRLKGRIPSRTSAVIDLSGEAGSCRIKLRAVLYDGREFVNKGKSQNICKLGTWIINDEDDYGD